MMMMYRQCRIKYKLVKEDETIIDTEALPMQVVWLPLNLAVEGNEIAMRGENYTYIVDAISEHVITEETFRGQNK
jgi:hypothetical protein